MPLRRTLLWWSIFSVCILVTGCLQPPLDVTPAQLANAVQGERYAAELVSNGADPETWRVIEGTLPPGLLLNRTTGALTGTPTAAGTYTFTTSVEDGSSPARTGERAYTLTVILALTVDTDLDPARALVAYNFTPTVTGGVAPYTIDIAGLPDGLTFDTTTGAISGTPDDGVLGDGAALTITVTDSGDPAQTVTVSATLRVQFRDVDILVSDLPDGRVGQAYNQWVGAILGVAPLTWSVTAGDLPGGLELTASTGVISGVPTTAGTVSFTVQVTDSDDPASVQTVDLSITIAP